MSDTPTYANLLARLFTGSPEEREEVMDWLQQTPVQAHSIEQDVRDRLRDALPKNRTIAAEAMLRLYQDRAAAIETLAGILKQGDPAASTDTVGLLRQLGRDAVPLVVLLRATLRMPSMLRPPNSTAGPRPKLFKPDPRVCRPGWNCSPRATRRPNSPGSWAWPMPRRRVAYDLTPAADTLRHRVDYAAGLALWRITWRVKRSWLERMSPSDSALDSFPDCAG